MSEGNTNNSDDVQHLEKKQLLALLRGIVQVIFYKTMTIQEVKEHVFGRSESSFNAQKQEEWIQLFSTLLSHAAYKNYSPSQFTDYLNSSNNKYSKILSEEEIQGISNFWNGEYHKIHSQLISQSNFTSALSEKRGGLKWRIDQLTNPDDLNETVETVAIVELNTTKEKKVVFEVDKPTLFYMVEQLQEIQNRINSLSM